MTFSQFSGRIEVSLSISFQSVEGVNYADGFLNAGLT